MMKTRLFLWCVIASTMVAGTSYGAVVGRITGNVTDVETGEALIGISVQLQGTTMGAVTDVEGKYTILNVPQGDYVVRFSGVGYQAVEVAKVHVSPDLATFQSVSLKSTAVELGAISVTAVEPIVQKDRTTMISVVKAAELRAMPQKSLEQVVGQQNSVVRKTATNFGQRNRGQREASGTSAEINLRGGRPSEVAVYIDGYSIQDPLTGLNMSILPENVTEEMTVQSGAFPIEYGHVASGVVNIITHSGGDFYKGEFEVRTDNFMGSKSYDWNTYLMNFGGPFPGLEKGKFFIAAQRTWLGDRSPSSNTEATLTRFGLDDASPNNAYLRDGYQDNFSNPQRLPHNSMGATGFFGKFDYSISANMKFQFTGASAEQNWREYRHEWIFNTRHQPRYRDKSLILAGKLTHTVNSKTFYHVSIGRFQSERLRGDGVLFDNFSAYKRYLDNGDIIANPEEDDTKLYLNGGTQYYLRSLVDTTTPGSAGDTLVPVTLDTYYAGYLKRKSSYWGIKGEVNSQINPHHTLKLGFDAQKHSVRLFDNLDATQPYKSELVNRYGYDANGNETDDDGFQNGVKKPSNFSVYAADRFEWSGMIVSAGLRWDRFDYNSLRLMDLEYPMDPINRNPVSTDAVITENELQDSKVFTRWSPRIGVSFPVSDRTQVYANYARMVQKPDFNRLYVGYDFLAARIGAGSYYPFPSPNLEPEKTTTYEVGMTQQLGEFTSFGISAYYRDIADQTQIYHQPFAVPRAYDFYANGDYGTVKGIDLEFKMRENHNISAELKYTLMWANGTGSYPGTGYVIAWQNPGGIPKQTAPLDYDQRHNLVASTHLSLGDKEGPRIGSGHPLQNFDAMVVLQIESGTPYTPISVDNEITLLSFAPIPRGSLNSQNLPWQFTVDLALSRDFKMGSFSISPYVLILNLLDRENVVGVYEGSGKPDKTGWLETDQGSEHAAAFGDYRYRLAESNPTNYGNPRQIMAGLNVKF